MDCNDITATVPEQQGLEDDVISVASSGAGERILDCRPWKDFDNHPSPTRLGWSETVRREMRVALPFEQICWHVYKVNVSAAEMICCVSFLNRDTSVKGFYVGVSRSPLWRYFGQKGHPMPSHQGQGYKKMLM